VCFYDQIIIIFFGSNGLIWRSPPLKGTDLYSIEALLERAEGNREALSSEGGIPASFGSDMVGGRKGWGDNVGTSTAGGDNSFSGMLGVNSRESTRGAGVTVEEEDLEDFLPSSLDALMMPGERNCGKLRSSSGHPRDVSHSVNDVDAGVETRSATGNNSPGSHHYSHTGPVPTSRPFVSGTSPGANAAMNSSSSEGLYGDWPPNQSAMGAQGHMPTAAKECNSSSLSACVLGPLNISRLLVSKGPEIEELLGGAGVQPNDIILGAAFDRDLIPSGVMIEEAHIITRGELEVDDQTRSVLLDRLGLLLSPHRALIFTPSKQYYSTPYLDGKRCAYQHLIEFHNHQQLKHDYSHLVFTPLVDPDESGTRTTGSSGVNFPRDSNSPGGNGSSWEEKDSTGPPDDSSQEKGGGQEDDGGDNDEGGKLNVTQDSKVHFQVVFNVLNIQTIRVEGSLSSKVGSSVHICSSFI